MSEKHFRSRTVGLSLIGSLLLGSCSQEPAASERRVPTGGETERVTTFRYPGPESRDISTHTEDRSGGLDARSYDQVYHQYCDKPEGAPYDSPHSALVSTRIKPQLPKFGGNVVMLQILPNAPECADGVLNAADESLPNPSPIPPNGEEKDMGSVNQWVTPK